MYNMSRVLLLCHGKAYKNESGSRNGLNDSVYSYYSMDTLDIMKSAKPTILYDLTKPLNKKYQSLYSHSYSFILTKNCPGSLFMSSNGEWNRTFFENIHTLLKEDGQFIFGIPTDFIVILLRPFQHNEKAQRVMKLYNKMFTDVNEKEVIVHYPMFEKYYSTFQNESIQLIQEFYKTSIPFFTIASVRTKYKILKEMNRVSRNLPEWKQLILLQKKDN